MKIAIVGGAGGVGASVAFNLLRMDAGHEVAIIDQAPNMITSHVMDLEQTLLLGAGRSVREGGDADLLDADVVIVAAAVPLTVNTSRMVYLEDNAAIVGGVLDSLEGGWGGVLLVVTNPVDPLCTWALRRSGIDRRRLVGYTINDSLRLRTGIGRALGVDPRRVDAWTIGEHGDASVPLFDRVTVNGEPVLRRGRRADGGRARKRRGRAVARFGGARRRVRRRRRLPQRARDARTGWAARDPRVAAR